MENLVMDIFALRPSSKTYYFITEETYFSKTQRRWPWATQTKGTPQTPLYLATCPECKNAIEIRELDRIRGENNRAPMEPFGKHYKHDVPGLEIIYSQERYDNCSLRAKVSLSSSEHRENRAFDDEILKFLVEHAAVVREVIVTKLGIKFSDNFFERIVKKFINESRYKCKGVTPSNLPFALIYWSESQSILAQYLLSRESEIEMVNAINGSSHFCVKNRQIISKQWRDILDQAEREKEEPPKKPVWGAHVISIFMHRQVGRGDERNGEMNHMTLTITEHKNNSAEGKKIYSKKIEYSNKHFLNAITAFERRLNTPSTATEAAVKKVQIGNVAYRLASSLLPDDWCPSWMKKQL